MSDPGAVWRGLVLGETSTWWAPGARAGLAGLANVYRGVVIGYRAAFDLGLLKSTRLPCATVSVGNITVGGTGKTTTVRWLARRLCEWGLRPAILSYGYRARSGPAADEVTVVSGPEGVREPVEVSGDEPQLLARSLCGVPVLVGRRRVLSGCRAWEEFAPDVCLLDDAFQYWRLVKDVEIVLLDAAAPFGNGRLLPRGPLREPPAALRRADAVILTHASSLGGREGEELRSRVLKWNAKLVLCEARHAPVRLIDGHGGGARALDTLRKGRWLAVSSLGRPESFEATLRELGVPEMRAVRFPDHHPYRREDVERLAGRVRAEGLDGVVTTQKDAVKIPREWLADVAYRILEVDLQFLSGQDALETLLRSRLIGHQAGVRPGPHGPGPHGPGPRGR